MNKRVARKIATLWLARLAIETDSLDEEVEMELKTLGETLAKRYRMNVWDIPSYYPDICRLCGGETEIEE